VFLPLSVHRVKADGVAHITSAGIRVTWDSEESVMYAKGLTWGSRR